MAQRELGPGIFTTRVMLSFEPEAVSKRFYPDLSSRAKQLLANHQSTSHERNNTLPPRTTRWRSMSALRRFVVTVSLHLSAEFFYHDWAISFDPSNGLSRIPKSAGQARREASRHCVLPANTPATYHFRRTHSDYDLQSGHMVLHLSGYCGCLLLALTCVPEAFRAGPYDHSLYVTRFQLLRTIPVVSSSNRSLGVPLIMLKRH